MNSKNGPEGMRDSKATKSVPLSKELQNHIGSKLRAVYGQLVQEPVPERFSELLKQLSNAEAPVAVKAQAPGSEEPQT
jgi:hypothetical protein